MMVFIGLGILFGGVALSISATCRAWHLQGRTLERTVTLAVGCACATVCAATAVFVLNGVRIFQGREAPVPDMELAATPEQLQRGAAIASAYCSKCHTKAESLAGGQRFDANFPLPVGSFVAANLTPAGELRGWSDGQIFRAIRNSLDAHGHWLIVMSYSDASRLSDSDIKAVIAYLRSLPARGAPTAHPPDSLNLLGLFLLGSGQLSTGKPVFNGVITAPPAGVSAAYGKYLVSYQDCDECHGRDLTGGDAGQEPPAGPDLNWVKSWNGEEFIRALRTGTDPGGHPMGARMPWCAVGRMSDDELSAIYEYLTHLDATRQVAARARRSGIVGPL